MEKSIPRTYCHNCPSPSFLAFLYQKVRDLNPSRQQHMTPPHCSIPTETCAILKQANLFLLSRRFFLGFSTCALRVRVWRVSWGLVTVGGGTRAGELALLSPAVYLQSGQGNSSKLSEALPFPSFSIGVPRFCWLLRTLSLLVGTSLYRRAWYLERPHSISVPPPSVYILSTFCEEAYTRAFEARARRSPSGALLPSPVSLSSSDLRLLRND